jgi:conjugative transfer pilus assembly protein TraH
MMKYLFILFFALMPPLHATVQRDLAHFFQKLGASTNTSQEGSFKDQSAGYYAGGSLFARNKVHNTELAHLQLPGYKAGCGGIDMHFGAFSYISSEKLVQLLRSIGSSVGSYGLMLALETMSPQVKNIVAELNDLAQKINMANINSCKVAATALGAVLPKSDAANHHLCNMIGNDGSYGGFSDYAAANQGCGAGGKRSEVLRAAKGIPQFAKMLGSEFNLAWKAIRENAFLMNDGPLAEFFMSVSGTLISREQGESFVITSKPSLVQYENLINALLYGGSAHVYACSDRNGDCLDVYLEHLVISPQESLINRIREILISIQNKIFDDVALSAQETAFLGSTKLPFYKMLNVITAYRRGEAPIEISDHAELAALDVLYHYINQILDVIEESLSHIKQTQVDNTHLHAFERSLRSAKNKIYQRRMGDLKNMESALSLIQKTEILEKSLSSKLGVLGKEGM